MLRRKLSLACLQEYALPAREYFVFRIPCCQTIPPFSCSVFFGSLSGQMYGYLVGAGDRWEYLVAGDPLRQIGEAEPEATQGEVILSPEAWELASTDFVATKTPQVMYVIF